MKRIQPIPFTCCMVIALSIMLLVMSSCNPVARVLGDPQKKAIVCGQCVIENNSTTIEKDSLYTTNEDDAWLRMLLECDSLGNVRVANMEELMGKYLNLQAQFKSVPAVRDTQSGKPGKNNLDLFMKAFAPKQIIPVKGKTETKYITKVVPGPVIYRDVPFVPWYYEWALYIAIVLLVWLALKMAAKKWAILKRIWGLRWLIAL